MLKVLFGGGKPVTFLASDGGEREIRWFLRQHGIRAERKGFGVVVAPRRLAIYALGGDEHLIIRKLNLPRLAWGRLAHYALGRGTIRWLMLGSSDAELHAEDGTPPPPAWSTSTQKRPAGARVTAIAAR